MVDAALSIAAEEGWSQSPIGVLDIGTGSGCLLVTLLAELPQATGLGTDVSGPAIAVAQDNARRHGLESRASWRRARSLAGIDGRFELVVSNPPYVASGDMELLEPEVRNFDPRTALDGGPDGLAVYREILAGVHGVVAPGWILLEVGAGQAPLVDELIAEMPPPGNWCDRRAYCDLGGQTRCVAWKARI